MAKNRRSRDAWLKERMDALDRSIELQEQLFQKNIYKKNHPIQYFFAQIIILIVKILKPFLTLVPFGLIILWVLFLDFIRDQGFTTLLNILLYGPLIAFIYFVFIRRD